MATSPRSGVAGHNDGAYLLDGELMPTRPAILATDSRASAQAAALSADPATAERLLALTGQVPAPWSPAAVLSWVREREPAVWARTRWVLSCKDWVRWCLVGSVATDPTDASNGFTDARTQDYSPEAVALLGLAELTPAEDRSTWLLPRMVPSTAVAGTLAPAAAAQTGLRTGTPVVTGAHDVDANAVGVGAVTPGRLSVVLGTFSINQVVTDSPVPDPRWQARAFLEPERWLHMSTSPAGAATLDWVLAALPGVTGSAVVAGTPPVAGDPASAIASARALGIAADDPLYLPFLHGGPRPLDADLRGAAFLGLRPRHAGADLTRAVLTGVVLNHRWHVAALTSKLAAVGPVRVTGGGARSAAWCQLLADALRRPVETTVGEEAGARGAAVLAGLGVGWWPDLTAAAAATVRVSRRLDPDPARAAVLDALDRRWSRAVDALSVTPNGDATMTE